MVKIRDSLKVAAQVNVLECGVWAGSSYYTKECLKLIHDYLALLTKKLCLINQHDIYIFTNLRNYKLDDVFFFSFLA